MKHRLASVGTAVGLALCLCAAGPPDAGAVQCPGSGALVQVCVKNPTSSTPSITISGSYITSEITCTSAPAASYSHTVTVTATNGATQCFTEPASGGLVTGMYVHHIVKGSQSQYQQVPVLYSTTTRPRIDWTYFPSVVTVTTAGDAYGGTCGTNCTLRQALNTANAMGQSSASPILIQFAVSPAAMTQAADLNVGNAGGGYITIDGTDSNGNPWIVGDALAAAQGSQDAFPRVVDLNNTTRFVLRGSNNTIKGLAINNTTAAGATPQRDLIDSSTASNTIQAVRLDGGAAVVTCSPSCTGLVRNLINSSGLGTTVRNVEARSAYGPGVVLGIGGAQLVRDSWVHHNYGDNLDVNFTTVTRNMVELAGQRATDGTMQNVGAFGVMGTAVSNITTLRNVVRNNADVGVYVTASNVGLSLSHDYVCGNGNSQGYYGDGAMVDWTGSSPSATGTGLTAAYNDGKGVFFPANTSSATMTFNNDSAFTANASTGFFNHSTVTVSAVNNQWRGVTNGLCHSSPDVSGSVTCDPIQGALPITLNASQPAFPSNVMLLGQTIRVQGTGFDAIAGNPLAGSTCTTGATPSTSCCRTPAKANVCGSGTHDPPTDGSSCVELQNSGGTWEPLSVTSVTPTTIVTQVPDTVFGCVGDDPSSAGGVSVTKLSGGIVIGDQKPYCTNKTPL